jgi:hypothetical protein
MFAIILFPIDVGIRRILLGREEWDRFVLFARRKLLFWKPDPRAQQSDESLTTLLARRDEVRSKQTAVAEERSVPVVKAEPRPELFAPVKPVTPPPEQAPTPTSTDPAKPPEQPENTTSRLLEAKRRAKK